MTSTSPLTNNNNNNHNNGSINPNLFVNYLPPSVNDDFLKQLFAPYGEIESCKVMLDLETGQSRCFGFVKFKSASEAEQAVLSLNGYRIENKTLVVKPANTSISSANVHGVPSTNVYVKGIPIGVTNDYLTQLFSGFGQITETKVLMDPMTNYSRGMGFVRFTTTDDAENAIEALNGQIVAGSVKPLVVRFADTEDERKMRRTRQQMKMLNPNRFSPYGPAPHFNLPYSHPYNPQFKTTPQLANTMNPMMSTATPKGNERNLFIYHLPGEADEALLYKLFSPYGAIESVKVITDPQSGTCKGYGFVKMVNVMDAWNAIHLLNGAKVGEKYIQVSIKKQQ